ncbi:queuosine-tRNA galactosyltransferase-like [Saccoglossus kowalevskii]|uniref:UDP-GlcNAc:betaGal beta-1,3-N-acetylglucosaminyltransferase-like protein 1-like n=1 Tax=Saccoglossus kowalevskii TaxID=10224 RepID=A0ABM0GWQ2_SACKO|nr:PREDICTED: UDP-GlcNAc:betaGal beta-1,3-N-acetylglucosaminyltransferase-like protein 1-like [Saccoglossus kowalevskii]
MEEHDTIDVTIVLPVYNAEEWLDECLQSISLQPKCFRGTIQLSVFNDSSTDTSAEILESWKPKLEDAGISVVIGSHHSKSPLGVGFAKNKAVGQSHGRFLCFQDADDVMEEERIELQYGEAKIHSSSIIGCRFRRSPADSTKRYTKWCNNLTQKQLIMQVYTSHGPTVIMPTWFCSREVFNKVGGFNEEGKGVPEDLIFFLEHLKQGGSVYRVDRCLLMYRYHPQAATHSVHCDTIWKIRMSAIQERVLSQWGSLTIWNAGKQGRKFYRSLTEKNKKKVIAFCDVDIKKIRKGVYNYEESQETPKPQIPILHFSDAKPPFIICVKLDLTGGGFESNLSSMNLKEGIDYYHFG